MVSKLKKEETVKELKDKFEKSNAVYTTDNLGLSVGEITELRNKLREVEAEYKIAKNTLIEISAKDTVFADLTKELEGPTALLMCYGDSTAPAGIVNKFIKTTEEKAKFKAGVLDGELLDEVKVKEVASLPSKEVLLSQIAGLLVAAPVGIAYVLSELGEKGEGTLKDFAVDAEKPAEAPEAKTEEKAEETPAAEAKEEAAPVKEESSEEAKAEEKAEAKTEEVEEKKEEGKDNE